MYIVKRNGKRFGKLCFTNYEDARSYVRKTIRKRRPATADMDYSDLVYSNPALAIAGFTIEWSDRVLPWKPTNDHVQLAF